MSGILFLPLSSFFSSFFLLVHPPHYLLFRIFAKSTDFMTILVTGGLGYIGSHTVVELLNNNFEVVILDDMSNSERFILNNIEQVSGKKPVFYPFDLKRKELLAQVFDAHQI